MENLVISDLHGNYNKLEAFINYRRDEEIAKYVLGDFFDSYTASDEEIISTLKLAMNNDINVTIGNHDVVYLNNAHSYFKCSGNRTNPMLYHVMNAYKDKFKAAFLLDGFIATHGGISIKHGKPFNTAQEIVDWCNSEWDWYRNQPTAPESLSSIFDIGSIRGGHQEVGGILWFTIGHEKADHRFDQIVGHTHRSDVYEQQMSKNIVHIGVDTPKFKCYNTTIRQFEDFCPEEYKNDKQKRKMLERQF